MTDEVFWPQRRELVSSVNVQKFKIAHLKPPLLRGGGFAEGEDGEVNNGTSGTPSPTKGVEKK